MPIPRLRKSTNLAFESIAFFHPPLYTRDVILLNSNEIEASFGTQKIPDEWEELRGDMHPVCASCPGSAQLGLGLGRGDFRMKGGYIWRIEYQYVDTVVEASEKGGSEGGYDWI